MRWHDTAGLPALVAYLAHQPLCDHTDKRAGEQERLDTYLDKTVNGRRRMSARAVRSTRGVRVTAASITA